MHDCTMPQVQSPVTQKSKEKKMNHCVPTVLLFTRIHKYLSNKRNGDGKGPKGGLGREAAEGKEGEICAGRERKKGEGRVKCLCKAPQIYATYLEARFRLCLTGLTNTELESPGHLLRAGFLLSRENELSISPWQSADSPAD